MSEPSLHTLLCWSAAARFSCSTVPADSYVNSCDCNPIARRDAASMCIVQHGREATMIKSLASIGYVNIQIRLPALIAGPGGSG